jgi:hypothetical protein
MDLKLHANATTTPRTRAYIQQSSAPLGALARELGIHSRTVARWKERDQVLDRLTRPHRLATTMTDWEEALIVELRRSLALPLDDITEAMRRCVNPQLSRSAIHRCLQRHGISARRTADKAPAVAFHTEAPAGFIHIDVKYLPPLARRRSYAGACPGGKPGSRSTAPPALSISKSCPIAGPKPRPAFSTASAPASRSRSIPCSPTTAPNSPTALPSTKKGKPPDKPSGQHPFDRLCAKHAITHRLTRPFRPQTNSLPSRRRGAWSNASTAASASISTGCRKTAPPTTAAFSIMPNAMLTSTSSSPITTTPACAASTTKRPPNSSLISRDTTRRPGRRENLR